MSTMNSETIVSQLEKLINIRIAEATAPRKWGTSKALAEYGGVSVDTIERLADKGLIESTYITPRARRYSFASFDALAERNKSGKAVA
ncbi:DNA-binding protein [Corynebacterium marquesiae]|uniref:DNA-binding protein n=1 Tax=Corynebacterium marquesiae TaxID=2913503 RepID=UPI0032ECD372